MEAVIPLAGVIGTFITVVGAVVTVVATNRGAARVAREQAEASPYDKLADRLDAAERRLDVVQADNERLRKENAAVGEHLRHLLFYVLRVLERVDDGTALADMAPELGALRVAAIDITDKTTPRSEGR